MPNSGLTTDLGRTATRSAVAALDVCMVGGKRMVRRAMADLLGKHGLTVRHSLSDSESLADALSRLACDVMILMLGPAGPAIMSRQVRELVQAAEKSETPLPLVVLFEKAGPARTRAAMQAGAVACVHLDAEPEELVRAISHAAGKSGHAGRTGKQSAPEMEPLRAMSHSPADLSGREVEVIRVLCEGLSSKEIARRLHISAKTVENHRYNIYRKCGVDSIAGLMRYAIQHGLATI